MFPDDKAGDPLIDGPSAEDPADNDYVSFSDDEFMSLFRRLDSDEVFSAGLKFVGLLRGF